MKKRHLIAFLTLVLLVFSVSLITFHRIPDAYPRRVCAENYPLVWELNIVLNCDSYEFMRLAVEPHEIFEAGNIRQPRPGWIFTASLLSKAMAPLRGSIVGWLRDLGVTGVRDWTLEFIPAYLSYVALNLFSLLFSFALFADLVAEGAAVQFPSFLLGSLLVTNDVVKMFLLTPHTAILVIPVSLFCVWSFVGLVDRGWYDSPMLLILSLLAGLGSLSYAAIFVFLPMSVLAGWISTRNSREGRRWSIFAFRSLLSTLLVSLPIFVWIAKVVSVSGGFYHGGIANDAQLVWMQEAMKDGTLIQSLGMNLLTLIRGSFLYLLVISAYGVFALAFRGEHAKTITPPKGPHVLGAGVAILMFLAFFSVVGLTAERVAFSLVPPILVATSVFTRPAVSEVSARRMGWLRLLSWCVFLIFTVYEFAKVGPFS